MASVNLVSNGLDVLGIVDNLIAVERLPIDRLTTQVTAYQSKISAYQTLNSKLLALKTSVESLMFNGEDVPLNTPAAFADRLNTSIFALRTATSSNEDVATATAEKGLATGDYSVTITRMAKFHNYASNGFASDTGTLTRTGTLTIQKGSGVPVPIAINDSNNTLQGIKNAINGANAGFTASVLNDGNDTPYRLVIASDDSGSANALTITNDLTHGTGAALTLAETTPAEDAQLLVNDVLITSGSNSVSGAIEGVTLNLKSESGTAVIKIDRDLDSIVAGVKGLVEKYNDVISYITAQSRYDAATKTAGLLAGDLTLRQAQTQISSALTQSIQSEGYSLQVLSQVGIKLTNSGTLSLDETKLRDRLSANFTDTAHLLLSDATDAEGNVVSLIPTLRGRLRTFTDSVDGTVQHVTEGLQKNISRINEQVEAMEARLEVRREILILQYQKADEALKQLSVLQSSLTSQMDILSSL